MNKPSLLKYITAGALIFLLDGFVFSLLYGMEYGMDDGTMGGVFRYACSSTGENNITLPWCAFLIPLSNCFTFVGLSLLVYTLFKTLNIKRVMSYLYFYATVSAAAHWFAITTHYQDIDNPLGHINSVYLFGLISFMYLQAVLRVRKYFISNKARWYQPEKKTTRET